MPASPPYSPLTPSCTGVALIACDVLSLEIHAILARAPRPLPTLRILQQGLHNDPPKLRIELQNLVDSLERDTSPHTIVFVYGLCSRGIEGVVAQHARLVAPRAHDCITLLLGSKEKYKQYAAAHPGTYWYSPGWNRCHTPPGPERHRKLRDAYIAKYGQDDADFLMETEQQWFAHYDRATYVDLGLSPTADDERFTRDSAAWLNWTYDRQHGDPALLRDLLLGPWDDTDRFLIAPPGHGFRMTADDSVLRTELTVKGAPLP